MPPFHFEEIFDSGSKKLINKWFGGFGKFLAIVFAVLCIGASFGGGNAAQSNQAASQIASLIGWTSGSAGTITNNTGDLTLDVAGNINLDADGGAIKFKDGGASFGEIFGPVWEKMVDLTFEVIWDRRCAIRFW